ncbi:MAG: glycosyltransferase family 9 protein [Mariprofundus sp.]|nr:glycosyltransferase family 9 protein [Mariprofundus sp.]
MLSKIKLFFIRRLMKKLAKKHQPQPLPDTVETIAVWQFGGLGDMLLATPVLQALGKSYPQAKIHIWCSNPSFADFLLRLPQVESVNPFPVYDFDTRTLEKKNVRHALNTCVSAMQAQQVDMLINLHRPKLLDWWMVEWQAMKHLKPACSMGVQPGCIPVSLLDFSIAEDVIPTQHYTQSYQQLLAKAGIDCDGKTCFLIEDEAQAKADALLQGLSQPWVCLHMGGRRLALEDKMWPVSKFIDLAKKLVQDGITPVLIGVEAELDAGERLLQEVPQALNLIGKTELGEMAGVLAKATLLIGHDSGPFHLAVAVHTPVVVICPREDAEPEYLAYDQDSVQVLSGENAQSIRVEQVYQTVKGLLE